jgi:uncharacterized protein (DUF1800 family)
MGQEKLQRKEFFKNIVGFTKKQATKRVNSPAGGPDPLFAKYSRKTLGERHYSQDMAMPNPNGPELNRIGNITSGLAAYTGAWSIWEVTHLLRRLSFGVKKTDIDALLALTPSVAVDNLLTISAPTIPSPTPLNNYQNTIADTSGITLGASWTSTHLAYANGSNDGSIDYQRKESLIKWSWGLCIDDKTTIREKMVHFWYHFIPINFDDLSAQQNNHATTSNDYMNLLRANALGNFQTLIKAISKTPAMLLYLGNQYSTATVPNENFARELMELFTMGKVPTQNYTEDDVIAASKIFSGWRVANVFAGPYPYAAAFNATYHNQSNKTFSSNFAVSPATSVTINNQTGANGANEFDLFFAMLFAQQGTTIAKYICRRLYRFFVYYDIDANIETNVITPLATALISNNWEMLPTLKLLFKSQHFFDVANRGVMIKCPVDYIAGSLRTLKINTVAAATTGNTQIENQYVIWGSFNYNALVNLEQGFGAVPNVSGWKAYYQPPAYYQNWINSNTIQKRSSLITSFLNGYYPGNSLKLQFDPIAFVLQFRNTSVPFPDATIEDPDLLIDAIMPYLFAVDFPASYKSTTKIATLLNGQVTNNYWTTAWTNYANTPTNVSYANIVRARLNSLLTTFLQLAEFQLM